MRECKANNKKKLQTTQHWERKKKQVKSIDFMLREYQKTKNRSFQLKLSSFFTAQIPNHFWLNIFQTVAAKAIADSKQQIKHKTFSYLFRFSTIIPFFFSSRSVIVLHFHNLNGISHIYFFVLFLLLLLLRLLLLRPFLSPIWCLNRKKNMKLFPGYHLFSSEFRAFRNAMRQFSV